MISASFLNSVEQCAAARGAHVIDLVVRRETGNTLVEVYIDSMGPVTTELCAQLSRDIAAIVASENVVRGSYRLMVSSPGIDRPLKYDWQYRKHIGRPFDIRIRTGDNDSLVSGRLVEATEHEIIVENGTTREQMHVMFDSIIEAKVKAPW